MAENKDGLTITNAPVTFDNTGGTPLVFPEQVRGGLANYTTTERNAIDGRILDNNMIIYNTTDSQYQHYTGGTRDSSGFMSGGSWAELELGGGGGGNVDTFDDLLTSVMRELRNGPNLDDDDWTVVTGNPGENQVRIQAPNSTTRSVTFREQDIEDDFELVHVTLMRVTDGTDTGVYLISSSEETHFGDTALSVVFYLATTPIAGTDVLADAAASDTLTFNLDTAHSRIYINDLYGIPDDFAANQILQRNSDNDGWEWNDLPEDDAGPVVLNEQDRHDFTVHSSIDEDSDTRQVQLFQSDPDDLTSIKIRHPNSEIYGVGQYMIFFVDVSGDPNVYELTFRIDTATLDSNNPLDPYLTYTYGGAIVDYNGSEQAASGADGDPVVVAIASKRDAIFQFNGANETDGGYQGYVPAPATSDRNKFLQGNGDWEFAIKPYTQGNDYVVGDVAWFEDSDGIHRLYRCNTTFSSAQATPASTHWDELSPQSEDMELLEFMNDTAYLDTEGVFFEDKLYQATAAITPPAEWVILSPSDFYDQGDYVLWQGVVYKNTTGTNNGFTNPANDSTNWEVSDDLDPDNSSSWQLVGDYFSQVSGDINITDAGVASLQPGSVRFSELDQTTSTAGQVLTSIQNDDDTYDWQWATPTAAHESDYFKVNSTGTAASATGFETIAIGSNAQSPGSNSITIGQSAQTSGTGATAIGDNAKGENNFALAFGSFATAEEQSTIALGANSHAVERNSIAVGSGATTDGSYSIALGTSASAGEAQQLVIGSSNSSTTINKIRTPGFTGGTNQYIAVDANGTWTTETVNPADHVSNAIAVDNNSGDFNTAPDASAGNAIAIGDNAEASDYGAIAIGTDNTASGSESTAIGHQSNATHDNATALGRRANTAEDNEIRLGGSIQHITKHPSLAGHEVQDHELVSKAYVDNRIAADHIVHFTGDHANELYTNLAPTAVTNLWLNYNHDANHRGITDEVGSANTKYYGGFFSKTQTIGQADGTNAGFPSSNWTRVFTSAIVGDNTDVNDAAAQAELWRWDGNNGLSISISNRTSIYAYPGWRAGPVAVTDRSFPEVTMRLQLVKLPADATSLTDRAVVIASSEYEHYQQANRDLAANEEVLGDIQHFLIIDPGSETLITGIQNGEYLCWRWEWSYSSSFGEGSDLTAPSFIISNNYYDDVNGTDTAFHMPLNASYPNRNYRFELRQSTGNDDGDVIWHDEGNDNSVVIYDSSAGHIPNAVLADGNVIDASVSGATLTLTRQGLSDITFTSSGGIDQYTTGSAYAVGDVVWYATDNKIYRNTSAIAIAPATLSTDNWQVLSDTVTVSNVATIPDQHSRVNLAYVGNVLTAYISDNLISQDDFGGADGTNGGSAGLVPAPAATDNDHYLRGDGTWAAVSAATGYYTGPYDAEEVYSQHEVIEFQGELWRWTSATASTAGTSPNSSPNSWSWLGGVPQLSSATPDAGRTKVELTQDQAAGHMDAYIEDDAIRSAAIHPEWDRTVAYSEGDLVIFENRIYQAEADTQATPDWDGDETDGANVEYSIADVVFYEGEFYVASFNTDEGDPPPDESSDWEVTNSVEPELSIQWQILSPLTGGTNQLASSDELTPSVAYGDDTIALGAGARAGELITIGFTSINDFSDTFIQLQGATINGETLSSSNGFTALAGSVITVTQGTNVVELVLSNNSALTSATPFLQVTGNGKQTLGIFDGEGSVAGTASLGSGTGSFALGNGAVSTHANAFVIGTNAASTMDNQIMLGSDEDATNIGMFGQDNILYRQNNSTAVWANLGIQTNNNLFYNTNLSLIDPFDFARHNFEQFKRLASGNVVDGDIPEISYYTQAQVDDDSLVGASLGDISRIIKNYTFNGSNDSPDGYVIQTFHYNSDGNLELSYLTWIEGDFSSDDRDAIFGSDGDLDLWSANPSDNESNQRHIVTENLGSGGTYQDFYWKGFDSSNSNIDLSSTGNVLMLGQRLFRYDDDDNIITSRYFARRPTDT